MIAFDESRWPIVRVAKAGRFTTADATAHVIAVNNLLARGEPFAVAVRYDDAAAAAYEHDPAADAMHRRWLAANADGLAAWCVAVASVAPAAAAREGLIARLAAERAPGGEPVAVFADPDEAERWLAARIAAWVAPSAA